MPSIFNDSLYVDYRTASIPVQTGRRLEFASSSSSSRRCQSCNAHSIHTHILTFLPSLFILRQTIKLTIITGAGRLSLPFVYYINLFVFLSDANNGAWSNARSDIQTNGTIDHWQACGEGLMTNKTKRWYMSLSA